MTNCKFYSNGECTYFAEARNGNDLRTRPKRCCMRIVKPQIKLNGNAIYRVLSTNTIYYASDDLKLVKQNQAD